MQLKIHYNTKRLTQYACSSWLANLPAPLSVSLSFSLYTRGYSKRSKFEYTTRPGYTCIIIRQHNICCGFSSSDLFHIYLKWMYIYIYIYIYWEREREREGEREREKMRKRRKKGKRKKKEGKKERDWEGQWDCRFSLKFIVVIWSLFFSDWWSLIIQCETFSSGFSLISLD